MGTIEEVVEIPASPPQVWALAADPARFGEWLTMHRSWRGGTPTDVAVGDRATALVRVGGVPLTITWTIEEYAPPRAMRLRGTAPAGVRVSITLDIEAVAGIEADASTMRITARFDGPLLTGPVGRVVQQRGRRELRASTTRLRELLS